MMLREGLFRRSHNVSPRPFKWKENGVTTENGPAGLRAGLWRFRYGGANFLILTVVGPAVNLSAQKLFIVQHAPYFVQQRTFNTTLLMSYTD